MITTRKIKYFDKKRREKERNAIKCFDYVRLITMFICHRHHEFVVRLMVEFLFVVHR